LATGKLYRVSDNQFIANVNYQFHEESATSWWGELVMTENIRMGDEAGCIIELEDRRRGKCRLKKRVNRAVTGVPPRYVYHFIGTSLLK